MNWLSVQSLFDLPRQTLGLHYRDSILAINRTKELGPLMAFPILIHVPKRRKPSPPLSIEAGTNFHLREAWCHDYPPGTRLGTTGIILPSVQAGNDIIEIKQDFPSDPDVGKRLIGAAIYTAVDSRRTNTKPGCKPGH